MTGNRPGLSHGALPQLSIDKDAVHVWQVSLDGLLPEVESLQRLLSEAELDRAARFHFEANRTEFCLGRAILRLLLSSYGVAPADRIVFTYSAQGKPALAPDHESSSLQFNMSHTRGRAVYAFVHSRAVGIDVEHLREVTEADRIVERFFSAEERAEYQSLPAEVRPQGFFNGWTRKEAFIKALGAGLHYPLDSFAVTLTPGRAAQFVHIGGNAQAADGWQLADVSLEPTYVVALAVQGSGLRLCNRIWNLDALGASDSADQ